MAEYGYGLKYTIYDYSTDDLTEIPEAGELRYFDTIIDDAVNICHVIGDGSSQVNALPFQEILRINATDNVDLEALRIVGNTVIVTNKKGSTITIEIGTTGSSETISIVDDESIKLYFDGEVWQKIAGRYNYTTGSATVADAGGAYVAAAFTYTYYLENGFFFFQGWGFAQVDNSDDEVQIDITIPQTLATVIFISGTYNGYKTSDPSSLFDVTGGGTDSYSSVALLDSTSIKFNIKSASASNFTNGHRHLFSLNLKGTV